jgi:hypothetical protein
MILFELVENDLLLFSGKASVSKETESKDVKAQFCVLVPGSELRQSLATLQFITVG